MRINGEVVCGHKKVVEKKGDSMLCGGLRTQGVFKRQKDQYPPLISIITVCLNSAETIERCIQSVLAQTYSTIEYIVIDGQSTDNTVEIIQSYQEYIDYFISEPDAGRYAAINKGLSLAHGDYILLLNSDSWYADECVELLFNTISQKQVDLVSALTDYVDSKDKFKYQTEAISFDEKTHVLNPVCHETLLVSAEIYNKFGPYSEDYMIYSDFHFVIKLYEAGLKHYVLKKPLMTSKITDVLETDSELRSNEKERIFREQFPYVSTEDLNMLSKTSTLSKQDILGILNRNRIYTKFWRAVFAFSKVKWSWGEQFLSQGGNLKTDFLRIEIFNPDRVDLFDLNSRRVDAFSLYGIDAGTNTLISNSEDVVVNSENVSRYSPQTTQHYGRKLRGSALYPIINRADILNFNEVIDFWNYIDFEQIAHKPVCWTFSNMAPITGGCQYSYDCDKYKIQCADCHLIQDNDWNKKREAYSKLKHITVICPSQWLARKVEESALLSMRDIRVVPDPLPLYQFFPVNKITARIKLGLELGKRYLLFGGTKLKFESKEKKIIANVLTALKDNGKTDIEILTYSCLDTKLPFPQKNIGFYQNAFRRLLYSAADVLGFVSTEDGSTTIVDEAMACGTIVVAFPIGNIPELIEHGQDGYLANKNSMFSFATGIEWALSLRPRNQIKRSTAAVKRVKEKNNPLSVANRYLEIYREIKNKIIQ